MIFLESDYLERDPYRKFVVGLAHAFGAVVLTKADVPFMIVVFGYPIKEIMFDLARVFTGHSSKWLRNIWTDWRLVADSLIDWAFWWMGAAMVAYDDVRYGFAGLSVGAEYVVAGKMCDGL